MTDLMTDAAWVLATASTLSIVYELYRSTVRAGTSAHDTMRGFVVQLPQYAVAAVVVVLLFVGEDWAAWVGLTFCVLVILISIFVYNPRIMLERRPGTIDWFEDLVFTGLMFVAATQLIYEVALR